ncbi:MAG: glycosyltransferase family 117 protein [Gemmatimonadaceae bacterium]
MSTGSAARGRSSELDYTPSYRAAAIAATLVFVLYLVTLSPSTAMWDTSEYISAAYDFGLPHPPGNPFFVILGRLFAILPIAPNVAMRINILAALCSAGAAGMWFLITERVLVGWLAERWQRIVGGSLGALIGATAFTVWAQSVVNEKVYTVSLLGLALVSWVIVRWCDDPDGPRADKLLVLIAYLSGLGYANHMAGFLAVPAVAAAVVIRRPRTLIRWKLLLAIAGALVLGMTPFLTQPLRAARFPGINEGEPTGCETHIGVGCTFSKATYERFKYNFNRAQYGKPALVERQAPFVAQIEMWWLYFRWQWLRDPFDNHGALQRALATLFLLLGGLGGYVHWKRDRRSFSYFGPLMFTVTFALIYYMNFKYGASQALDLGDNVPREVRDRDYFYLWSFSAWSVWAALGFVYAWETLAALFGTEKQRVGEETLDLPRKRSWLLAGPVLAIALIPLFANWQSASRAGQTDTADFAADLLNSVEPYGILVTSGDNDTFPLWYAQEVEGIRRDVIVACLSLLNTDWYTRQLLRRPVYEYDSLHGPSIYRGKVWKKPAGPPLRLTMDQADAVPPAIELSAPQTFAKEGTGISAIINPRHFDSFSGLERADLFVLYMIRDGYPDRPFFFSRTTGGYPEEMGFAQYTLTVGLARKLMPEVPRAGDGIVSIPGEGMFDALSTRALWETTFKAQVSLAKRELWVDRPSAGIPFLYVRTGADLSDALNQLGLKAEASRISVQTERIARATQLTDLLASMTK